MPVAKVLLEAGAKVSMPTESFESPLTLAACGGHVELVCSYMLTYLFCSIYLNRFLCSLTMVLM